MLLHQLKRDCFSDDFLRIFYLCFFLCLYCRFFWYLVSYTRFVLFWPDLRTIIKIHISVCYLVVKVGVIINVIFIFNMYISWKWFQWSDINLCFSSECKMTIFSEKFIFTIQNSSFQRKIHLQNLIWFTRFRRAFIVKKIDRVFVLSIEIPL